MENAEYRRALLLCELIIICAFIAVQRNPLLSNYFGAAKITHRLKEKLLLPPLTETMPFSTIVKRNCTREAEGQQQYDLCYHRFFLFLSHSRR